MSALIELDDEEFIGTIRTEVTAEDSAAIVDFVRETPVGIASAKQGRDISEVYSLQAGTPIYAKSLKSLGALGTATSTGDTPIYPTRPPSDLTGAGTEDDPYTYSDAMKLIDRAVSYTHLTLPTNREV